MKIAIYKDTFANNRGADVAVKNLAAGLVERGHAVTLFDRTQFAEKVRGDYDVIISAGTNEILDLAKVEGLPPIVQQFHTDPAYPFRHWIRRWRRNRAIKAALKKAAAYQLLSVDHVGTLQKLLGGVPDEKIFVVGNWSSFEGHKLQEEKSEKIIIFPGAINKDKNQALLVEAFSKIAVDFPDWQIHIYGKGGTKDEEALARQIKTRRLEGRILMKGYADLTEAYSKCSFVAFPSKTEGFPLTIIDAAMFAKPTLMIRDWVGCGEVVAPENYAGALRRLMSDGQCRRISGEKSQAFCRGHYSRKSLLDKWESLLFECRSGCVSQYSCQFLPLVSIIIPAYNVAGTVSATIEALLAQDYPNFEAVAVDDGSSDATAEILDRFAGSDSRLRVVHKQNGGYGSAINAGLAEARGEWIGILESDDVCRADMLSRLVAEGEGRKADMVKADWRLWWHEKGDARPAGKIRRSWRGHFLTRRERLELCRVSPSIWSAIYRKDFLNANGIRCLETPGAAFQDTSFNIKAVLSCERLVVLPEAFVDYRQDNPNSSVRSKTQVESILFEYAELFTFLRRRSDIAQWATDCVRGLEYKAYLWNLKRIAPEQRLDFIVKVRESGCVRKLFAKPERLIKKINSQVARRERRKRRLVSLHINAGKIEFIVFGRTIFFKSF